LDILEKARCDADTVEVIGPTSGEVLEPVGAPFLVEAVIVEAEVEQDAAVGLLGCLEVVWIEICLDSFEVLDSLDESAEGPGDEDVGVGRERSASLVIAMLHISITVDVTIFILHVQCIPVVVMVGCDVDPVASRKFYLQVLALEVVHRELIVTVPVEYKFPDVLVLEESLSGTR